MKPSLNWDWAHRLLHFGLLRSASLMVPGTHREEWLREWRGELWHVQQACKPMDAVSGRGEREVTAFCLGAFQDAISFKPASAQRKILSIEMEGTASRCLLVLGAILVASYTVSLLLPGVRAEQSLWPRRVNPNLVLIQEDGYNNGSSPTISPTQFRSWSGRRQKYFDGFAFYTVTRETLGPGLESAGLQKVPASNAAWRVARASSNFFVLLGLPVEFAEPAVMAGGDLPKVMLSETVWKREFSADPHVAGSTVRFGPRVVRIAGVAADGSLGLPGRVDAWMLDSDADKESGGAGYVVAHLTAIGAAAMWASCVHITANEPDESQDDLMGVSLEEWRPAPRTLYLFAVFLALLSVPAVTSVSLGEYSPNPLRISWTRRLCLWSFLCAKILLLLPIVYFLSLDLAYGLTTIGRERASLLQLFSSFAIFLAGMWWVLKDQRQRCPVCIRCVAHPAQVGQASRTFLDWNGTEMMCMSGHTLLHVPCVPTSWFSTQRWLYLDPSWRFLFASSGAGWGMPDSPTFDRPLDPLGGNRWPH